MWYDYPKKGIAINMWAPAWYYDSIRKLNVKELAKCCHEAGADILFMWQGWSQDHFGMSFYQTEWGPVHPNLTVHKDHMRDFVDELHQYGIKVVAYYSYKDRVVWDREADWRQVDKMGKPFEPKSGGGGTGRFGDLCPNSPYHDYIVARQTEILEKYDIDGACLMDSAYFNPSSQVCYCKYCQEKFRRRFSRNLPDYTGAWTKEWVEYLKWKSDCMVELYDDMRMAHQAIRPDFPMTHFAFGCRGDYEGAAGLDYERLTEGDTFVNSITQWNEGLVDGTVNRNPAHIWVTGMMVRYLRAISEKPVHLHIGRFTYDREFQCMPEHEMRVAGAATLAAGGSFSVADNLYPSGELDRGAYEMIGRLFRDFDRQRDYLEYEEEIGCVAIWYSKSTLDYMGCVYPGQNLYYRSIEGAYKFFIEQHIPVQFVVESRMSLEKLKAFSLIVLPENVVMTNEHAQLLRTYVREGGCVIACGSTGMMGESAEARENFALADVFGVSYRAPSIYHFHYYHVTQEPFALNISGTDDLISRGKHCKVCMHPDAKEIAHMILPATEQDQNHRAVTFAEDMHPWRAFGYPAAVFHSYGQGACIYFSGNPFYVYGVYGYTRIRTLLRNCVDQLTGGDYPVMLDGPVCVEVAAYRQGTRFIVPLVNYASDMLSVISMEGGAMAEQGLPIYDLRLCLCVGKKQIRRIFMALSDEEVSWKMENTSEGRISIHIPVLKEYDRVIVELEP